MKITLNKQPRFKIGTEYVDYATKKNIVVVGYRYSVTVMSDTDKQSFKAPSVVIQYVTRLEVAGQTVTNYETPESRIFRSIHASEKVKS